VVTATTYEALDFVAGLYTFSNVLSPVPAGDPRTFTITGARLHELQDATPVAWSLALFRQQPTIASADEATLDMTDANADFVLDFIHFPATASTHVMDLGSSVMMKGSFPNGPMTIILDDVDADQVSTEDLNLYGALQVLGTWVAGATTAPIIDLFIVND
jgi:hypothetical protein